MRFFVEFNAADEYVALLNEYEPIEVT